MERISALIYQDAHQASTAARGSGIPKRLEKVYS